MKSKPATAPLPRSSGAGKPATRDAALGAALLDGVILAGWRTGAHVHVEFQKISSCAGKPAGPCFEGTIHIERAPKE